MSKYRAFVLAAVAVFFSASAVAADTLLLAAGAGYRKPVLELLQNFTQASGIHAHQLVAQYGVEQGRTRAAASVPTPTQIIGKKFTHPAAPCRN